MFVCNLTSLCYGRVLEKSFRGPKSPGKVLVFFCKQESVNPVYDNSTSTNTSTQGSVCGAVIIVRV